MIITNTNFICRFVLHQPERWGQLVSGRLEDLKIPTMSVIADKGFNYSTVDEAFIVQKKNHFQVSIDLKTPDPASVRYVKHSETGVMHTPSFYQINFFGVKSESLNSVIKVCVMLKNDFNCTSNTITATSFLQTMESVMNAKDIVAGRCNN